MVLIFLIISVFLALFFLSEVIAIFTTDAPFVPIPNGVEDKIIEALKLGNDSVLYDLGCGDARILLKAVEKYPSIKAVGVEKSFFPYLLAKFYTRKYKNIEIKREDIFETNVSDATHIFIYLYPQIVEKLMSIFDKKCKKGTRIVSCDFEDKDRKPEERIGLGNNKTGRGKRLIVYIL